MMVNNPLIMPYFLGGGGIGGFPLDSHGMRSICSYSFMLHCIPLPLGFVSLTNLQGDLVNFFYLAGFVAGLSLLAMVKVNKTSQKKRHTHNMYQLLTSHGILLREMPPPKKTTTRGFALLKW